MLHHLKSDIEGVEPKSVTLPKFKFRDIDAAQEAREVAERIAETRTIREGLDSWREISRVESFTGWTKIGFALLIGKKFALRVSGAPQAWGSAYSSAFNRWLREHGFLPGPTRSVAIELAENAGAITAWRDTLPERQRKRLVHPLSVTRRWRASLACSNEKGLLILKQEAMGALRRFIACMKALPPDEAAPIREEAIALLAAQSRDVDAMVARSVCEFPVAPANQALKKPVNYLPSEVTHSMIRRRQPMETTMALGRKLALMSEEGRQKWAAHVMEKMTDVHTIALHIAGWKIVGEDGQSKWPFGSEAIGCDCPDWCSDIATAKASNNACG